MPRQTHYTEEPSRLYTTSSAAHARIRAGGFVTREMLEQTIEELRRDGHMRHGVLVDLRAVTGYESSCLLAARQFLRDAPRMGLRRIALVGSSSVMHTASRLAAYRAAVEIETFHDDRSAVQWLQPQGVVPRRRPSSVEVTTGP